MEGAEIALVVQAVASPEEIVAEQATSYNENLTIAKSTPEKQTLLSPFPDRPLSTRMVEGMEDRISCEEFKWAITNTWWGKTPGPDGLHIEFYLCNEKIFVLMLTTLFNEILEKGALPTCMKAGIITLLFREKDLRDIHNYRPIALLNTDYIILARVSTA